MSEYPEAGSEWRSRDPRDDGLVVTVLGSTRGYVRIHRFRKTLVKLSRWYRAYEPAQPSAEDGGEQSKETDSSDLPS